MIAEYQSLKQKHQLKVNHHCLQIQKILKYFPVSLIVIEVFQERKRGINIIMGKRTQEQENKIDHKVIHYLLMKKLILSEYILYNA